MNSRRQVGSPTSTWARSSLTLTGSRTVGRRSQTPSSATNRRPHPAHASSPTSRSTALAQSGQPTRGGSAELIDDLVVDLVHAADRRLPAKEPIDPLGRRRSELRQERGVAQQPQHSLDERRPVVLRDQEAATSVVHHLSERGDTEGDDGLAAGHRFLRRQRKPLEERGKHEDVCQIEDRNLFGLRDVAGKYYGPGEAELADQRLEVGPQRSRADPDQSDGLGRGALDLGERLDEKERILSMDERSQAEKDPLALEAVARDERGISRRRRVLRAHAAIYDRHMIRPQF